MIAKEAAAGHTVAIHSASHNYQQIYSSVGAYFDDLNEMSDIIYSQTGSRPTLVRFPGGSSNSVSKKYCKGIMTELAKDVTDQGYNTMTGTYQAVMPVEQQAQVRYTRM